MRTVYVISGFLGAIVLCAIVCGCASEPGVVFDRPVGVARVWPAPPDEARVRYVGQLRGRDDLKPGRGVGESIGAFLFGKEEARGMVSPLGVCTDGADRVFIADSNAQVVHVFDLKGRRYAQWAPKKPWGSFVRPVAVAYDAGGGVGGAGRVLVSDAAAGVVFVFDLKGVCTGTIGEGVLRRPCGLTVRAGTGTVAVADVDAHQVVFLSRQGAEVARLGSRGTDAGRFNFPTFVAYDSAGRLYVSDSLNFRVQVFAPDLEFVRTIGSKGDMPGYFSQPKGIAVDPDDNIYVVDANFEAVQVFRTDGALLMSFGSEGKGPGEFWLPAGVFADPSGRVWVADTYNRRVQVFQYIAEAEAEAGAAGAGGAP